MTFALTASSAFAWGTTEQPSKDKSGEHAGQGNDKGHGETGEEEGSEGKGEEHGKKEEGEGKGGPKPAPPPAPPAGQVDTNTNTNTVSAVTGRGTTPSARGTIAPVTAGSACRPGSARPAPCRWEAVPGARTAPATGHFARSGLRRGLPAGVGIPCRQDIA